MKVELWVFTITDLRTGEFETCNVYYHSGGKYRTPIAQFHAEYGASIPLGYREPLGDRHITITHTRIVHHEQPRGTVMQFKLAGAI